MRDERFLSGVGRGERSVALPRVFKFRAGGGDCCSKARRCSGEYGPPLCWKRLERARRCVFGVSGHVLMLALGGPKASLGLP